MREVAGWKGWDRWRKPVRWSASAIRISFMFHEGLPGRVGSITVLELVEPID